ncbi:NB-ARC domain-containing protein [Acrocarpospora corrugata]|uniref:NB-ARC domain-containing protein n=1 Tax=Acrocarpospora corrugata TaxID=35763 RepID=UPI0014783DED|nr:NB-ARC domain-containing protein [Acrocarpospora corrugata]
MTESSAARDVNQIGSARDVSIGGVHLQMRAALPDASATAAPAGLTGLPRPPAAVFVGRADALAGVERALAAGSAGVITQAAVYGLGGVGKSELALQYATRHRDRYRVVWWAEADTPAQIQTSLAGLARAICAGSHSVAAGQATVEEAVEEAVAWALSWMATHPGWLLVLDNVEQVGDVEPYLGRLRGGQVLLTTRRDIGWRDAGCTAIDLGVLAREPAVELLADLIGARTGEAVDLADLADLADELGHLPLALTQAGAFVARTPGMTVARYRGPLRTSPARLYGMTAPGRDPQRVVARVWTLTRDRIAEQVALAPSLLALLAYYAPDQLPVDVLHHLPDADELRIGAALGLLASYSVITLTGDAVSVHRLVQAVTLADLTPRPAERSPAPGGRAAGRRAPRRSPADRELAGVRPAADPCPRRAALRLPGPGRGHQIRERQRRLRHRHDPATSPPPSPPGRARPGTPRHAERSRRPRPLHRAGGRRGRGTGPVRRPAARSGSGPWAPSTPTR